jgi:hypothetical protein
MDASVNVIVQSCSSCCCSVMFYLLLHLESLGVTQAIRLCNSYLDLLDGVLAPPNLLLVTDWVV